MQATTLVLRNGRTQFRSGARSAVHYFSAWRGLHTHFLRASPVARCKPINTAPCQRCPFPLVHVGRCISSTSVSRQDLDQEHKKGRPSFSATELNRRRMKGKNKKVMMYFVAGAVAFLGLSYAFVPVYQAFCKATGFGKMVRIRV